MMKMAATSLPLISVIFFMLRFRICITQQMECSKGSLSVQLKDNPNGFIKINCSNKTMTASLSQANNEKCFHEGGATLAIISRATWTAAQDSRAPELKTEPAEYVVVDGSSYSTETTDYASKMRALQEHQNKEFGSLMDNFYVSDDGHVYEGIGWDHFNHVRSGGINSLRIGFLKEINENPPSSSALEIFKKLIKAAICLGKLRFDYKLIPSYYVFDYKNLEPATFERKDIKSFERFRENTDLGETSQRWGDFPLIFKEDWAAEPFKYDFFNHSSKIEFVVVGNSKSRCFKTKQCMRILKNEEKDFFGKNRDFPINFMFGEDGLAYEVFGWDKTWDNYWLGKKALVVDFFGRYNSYLPMKSVFHAFDRLMRFGILWGKLSPDYKIVSIRKIYTASHVMGDMLDNELRKMDRFTDDF